MQQPVGHDHPNPKGASRSTHVKQLSLAAQTALIPKRIYLTFGEARGEGPGDPAAAARQSACNKREKNALDRTGPDAITARE
jgi:hypothetical protein